MPAIRSGHVESIDADRPHASPMAAACIRASGSIDARPSYARAWCASRPWISTRATNLIPGPRCKPGPIAAALDAAGESPTEARSDSTSAVNFPAGLKRFMCYNTGCDRFAAGREAFIRITAVANPAGFFLRRDQAHADWPRTRSDSTMAVNFPAGLKRFMVQCWA